ncbi:TPA: glycosyltransferase, partial [Citrobacter freundii]|nr:glycosyltransferase [Citrobacter freundii]
DIEKFKPYEEQKKLLCRNNIGSVDNDDIVIGMIGRLWPQKNPMCLLQAVAAIIKNNKKVKCFFIGDGELYEQMAYFIETNALNDNIHLFGWRDDTPVFLNALDVFVLPSRWEGMPLAILEAKSCGLPCVVSNIQGNRNIIDDVDDGLLFDLDLNWHDLYEKLKLLIANEQLRHRLGNKARLNTINDYNIIDRINKIEVLYLEKCKNKFLY